MLIKDWWCIWLSGGLGKTLCRQLIKYERREQTLSIISHGAWHKETTGRLGEGAFKVLEIPREDLKPDLKSNSLIKVSKDLE